MLEVQAATVLPSPELAFRPFYSRPTPARPVQLLFFIGFTVLAIWTHRHPK